MLSGCTSQQLDKASAFHTCCCQKTYTLHDHSVAQAYNIRVVMLMIYTVYHKPQTPAVFKRLEAIAMFQGWNNQHACGSCHTILYLEVHTIQPVLQEKHQ